MSFENIFKSICNKEGEYKNILLEEMPKIRRIISDEKSEEYQNLINDNNDLRWKIIAHYNSEYLMYAEASLSEELLAKVSDNSSMIDLLSISEDLEDRYNRKYIEIPKSYVPTQGYVCVVGAGAIPDTMLYFLKLNPSLVVEGIDIDHNAFSLGNQLLSCWDDNVKSKIFLANGAEYDYKIYNLVYIEGFVQPKLETINRVIETCKKGTIILVDNPTGIYEKIYEKIDLKYLNNLKLINKTSSNYKEAKFYTSEILFFEVV